MWRTAVVLFGFIAAFALTVFILIIATEYLFAQTACGVVQERFRYERRTEGQEPYYVEIYETRQQDCDSSSIVTSSRQETRFRDRPEKVGAMQEERQAHVLAANKLQQRINDLNALP